MSVKERLIVFVKHKGISIRKFEKIVGLSYGYVNNIRVSIQPDKVLKIVHEFPDLNSGWLLTGEGNMIKENISLQNSNEINGQMLIDQLKDQIEVQKKTIEFLMEQIRILNKTPI